MLNTEQVNVHCTRRLIKNPVTRTITTAIGTPKPAPKLVDSPLEFVSVVLVSNRPLDDVSCGESEAGDDAVGASVVDSETGRVVNRVVEVIFDTFVGVGIVVGLGVGVAVAVGVAVGEGIGVAVGVGVGVGVVVGVGDEVAVGVGVGVGEENESGSIFSPLTRTVAGPPRISSAVISPEYVKLSLPP